MLLMPFKGGFSPSRHTAVCVGCVFLYEDAECISECCGGEFWRYVLADHMFAVWLKANTAQAVNLTGPSQTQLPSFTVSWTSLFTK